jgi:hypothetical protein
VPAEENKAIFRRYVADQADGTTLERGPEDVKRFTEEYRSAC